MHRQRSPFRGRGVRLRRFAGRCISASVKSKAALPKNVSIPIGLIPAARNFGGGASATLLTCRATRRCRQESMAKFEGGGGRGLRERCVFDADGAFRVRWVLRGGWVRWRRGASMPRSFRLREVAAVRTLTMWGGGWGREFSRFRCPLPAISSRPKTTIKAAAESTKFSLAVSGERESLISLRRSARGASGFALCG